MAVFRSGLVASSVTLVAVACGGSTVEHARHTKPGPHVASDGGYADADRRPVDTCSVSTCVGNRCSVAVVTQSYSQAIAVGAGRLEWLAADGVMSIPADGGTPTTIVPGKIGAFAVDSASVYFTTLLEHTSDVDLSNALEKVSLDGGTPTTLASFMITADGPREIFAGRSPAIGSHAIAVDATGVYFATSPSGDTTDAYKSVMKVPLSGGSPTTIASPMADPIAVDATRLYGFDGTHALVAVPLEGGAPTVLVPPHTKIFIMDFAIDATSVYWSEADWTADCCLTSRIWKVAIQGYAEPTLLVSGQYSIQDISVDEASVYWVAHDDRGVGMVMKVPIEGGTPTVLASRSDQACLGGLIAVDEKSVYWNWGNTIQRLTPK